MGLRHTTIGRKDTRITIKKRTSTNHAVTNEPVDTESTIATVWAEELGPNSNERYEANQQVAQRVIKFRVRWSHTLESNLDETCLILKGSTRYEVANIDMIGRRSEILITAGNRDNG